MNLSGLTADKGVCRAPIAGGQYHWVSILAPTSSQKLFSYITGEGVNSLTDPTNTGMIGWLTVTGWQAVVAAAAYICGTLIQGFIEVVNPAYTSHLWHTTMLLYGTIALAIFVTTVLGTVLPKVESFLLVVYILGFFGVMVPLVCLGPHATAKDVFITFMNDGGWSSQTLSFFVSLSGNAFLFLGRLNPNLLFSPANIEEQAPTRYITYVFLPSLHSSTANDQLDERGDPQCCSSGATLNHLVYCSQWRCRIEYVYRCTFLCRQPPRRHHFTLRLPIYQDSSAGFRFDSRYCGYTSNDHHSRSWVCHCTCSNIIPNAMVFRSRPRDTRLAAHQ